MDNEGYPEESELELIKNWDYNDFLGLVNFIEERWAYAESGYFKKEWVKEDLQGRWVLNLELHTAGWSGNESIIDAILENMMFRIMWYKQWKRGGHYYFEINPINVGYKLVSEYSTDSKVSRQYISKTKDKFDWIIVSDNIRLLKPKT